MPVYSWNPSEFFETKYVPNDVLIKRARIAFDALPICEDPDKVLEFMKTCLARADATVEALEANKTSQEIDEMIKNRYEEAISRLNPSWKKLPPPWKPKKLPRKPALSYTR